jgi:hypothetical protein
MPANEVDRHHGSGGVPDRRRGGAPAEKEERVDRAAAASEHNIFSTRSCSTARSLSSDAGAHASLEK